MTATNCCLRLLLLLLFLLWQLFAAAAAASELKPEGRVCLTAESLTTIPEHSPAVHLKPEEPPGPTESVEAKKLELHEFESAAVDAETRALQGWKRSFVCGAAGALAAASRERSIIAEKGGKLDSSCLSSQLCGCGKPRNAELGKRNSLLEVTPQTTDTGSARRGGGFRSFLSRFPTTVRWTVDESDNIAANRKK